MKAQPKKISKKPLNTERFLAIALLIVFMAICTSAVLLLKTKEAVYDEVLTQTPTETESVATETQEEQPPSFPIGVDPLKETITEDPTVDSFLNTQITRSGKENPAKMGWIKRNIIAKLAQFSWYQNLASPVSRILVIEPGERKEQVVENFGDILNWTAAEEVVFSALVAGSSPELAEGKFHPGHYVVSKDATPEDIAGLLNGKFKDEVLSHYTPEIEEVVPLKDAMTLASLLEREAYDFEDMRFIAGVIWNRLFVDMNLQIDASLQYAKGSQSDEPWWPVVRPADKYIESPYNTYENAGLPPAPIANPSQEALLAALNPKKTDCMFYFHDKDGGFHCTPTYEEHVALLKQYYGQGR
jgi:cell division protein YceG involved in septum cleavage